MLELLSVCACMYVCAWNPWLENGWGARTISQGVNKRSAMVFFKKWEVRVRAKYFEILERCPNFLQADSAISVMLAWHTDMVLWGLNMIVAVATILLSLYLLCICFIVELSKNTRFQNIIGLILRNLSIQLLQRHRHQNTHINILAMLLKIKKILWNNHYTSKHICSCRQSYSEDFQIKLLKFIDYWIGNYINLKKFFLHILIFL